MGCSSSKPAVSTGGAATSAPPPSKNGNKQATTKTISKSKTSTSTAASTTKKTPHQNKKARTKPRPSPSSVAAATATNKQSSPRPQSDFQSKLKRIRNKDPAVRHFQGCWGDDMTEKEAIQLLSALSENETIRSIEFCANKNLGIKFCAAMAKLLEQNHELAVVSLRSNPNFGDEGIKLLCQGLEKNSQVLDFFIDGCGVGEAGAVMIGKMLSFNRKLFRLDVSNNSFTSAGVDFIAEGVIENGKWVSSESHNCLKCCATGSGCLILVDFIECFTGWRVAAGEDGTARKLRLHGSAGR